MLSVLAHTFKMKAILCLCCAFPEKKSDPTAAAEAIDWCGNHWRYPQTCTPGEDCEYYARWEYLEKTDDIKFTIQTTNTDRWTGIGFSDNTRMVGICLFSGFLFALCSLPIEFGCCSFSTDVFF